jgi:hypothetical protein
VSRARKRSTDTNVSVAKRTATAVRGHATRKSFFPNILNVSGRATPPEKCRLPRTRTAFDDSRFDALQRPRLDARCLFEAHRTARLWSAHHAHAAADEAAVAARGAFEHARQIAVGRQAGVTAIDRAACASEGKRPGSLFAVRNALRSCVLSAALLVPSLVLGVTLENLSPKDFDLACAIASSAWMLKQEDGKEVKGADPFTLFTFYLGRLTARDDRTAWTVVVSGRLEELHGKAFSPEVLVSCIKLYTSKLRTQ